MDEITKTEKIEEVKKVSINSYSVTFNDLGNLEALTNELIEETRKLNLEFEHLAEIKKIVNKIKKSAK